MSAQTEARMPQEAQEPSPQVRAALRQPSPYLGIALCFPRLGAIGIAVAMLTLVNLILYFVGPRPDSFTAEPRIYAFVGRTQIMMLIVIGIVLIFAILFVVLALSTIYMVFGKGALTSSHLVDWVLIYGVFLWIRSTPEQQSNYELMLRYEPVRALATKYIGPFLWAYWLPKLNELIYSRISHRVTRQFRIGLFRPFGGEESRTARQLLAPTLSAYGHVVTLSDSRLESAAPTGVELLGVGTDTLTTLSAPIFADTDWRTGVLDLIDTFDMIIVDVTRGSNNLAWEICTAFNWLPPGRIAFIRRQGAPDDSAADMAAEHSLPTSTALGSITHPIQYQHTLWGTLRFQFDVFRLMRQVGRTTS